VSGCDGNTRKKENDGNTKEKSRIDIVTLVGIRPNGPSSMGAPYLEAFK